jgi:hypothetical protein
LKKLLNAYKIKYSDSKPFYKNYVLDKQTQKISRNIPYKSTFKLELIHTDIIGPITQVTLSKARYLISFTDDFTRHSWVYLLKYKSQAFATFK